MKRSRRFRVPAFAALLAVAVLIALPLAGQEAYKLPPKNVLDILDAPPTPRVMLSPTRDLMLLIDYETMPSIAAVAEPMLRLAGLRITPRTNGEQVLSFNTGLTIKRLKDGLETKVKLPAGAKFTWPDWSPDGKRLAFARYVDEGIELWVADAATGEARALTGPRLNAVLAGPVWLPGSKRLLVPMIPEGRGPAPVAPRVPKGPNVQMSGGKQVKVSTYQDLLKTPFDEDLFEYYATVQLVEIDVLSGAGRNVGRPGLFVSLDPSPDGSYLFIYRIKRPFSFSVPCYDFARAYEVWNSAGEPVKVVADLPPAEDVPMNGVPTGPRDPAWQALHPATLVWAEALDGGDPEKDVPFRDKMMTLAAPFAGDAGEVLKLKHRFYGLTWLAAPGRAFATEFDWKKRWRTSWLVDVDRPGAAAPKKVFDLSVQDAYKDPGRPVMTMTPAGERVVLQDKDAIYLSGQGATPKGDRPFLDRYDLKTGLTTRLFRCGEGVYDAFIGFEGASRDSILISHESPAEPANYFRAGLRSGKRQALTSFKDPAPQLTGLKKELVKYNREDGVELSGTLYLPPDAKPGVRLPVVVWAYPLEYSDAGTAGQVRGSPYRFTTLRGTSQLFFVTQGYAVLDNATMPVIGDPKTMNDTFVRQIVSNAQAAIDKLDALGVGDRRRVGVGGHSYGAFMTANLLAHCDLFAAGIARSGAYNRTLTPFGFQSERRTLWEARDSYINMSPFMFADKIKTPLLLIHGEADNNSGTFPIQSERLFAALKGFGATARYVTLPYESHGYSARESVLTVLAEMFEWFDKYVKNRS